MERRTEGRKDPILQDPSGRGRGSNNSRKPEFLDTSKSYTQENYISKQKAEIIKRYFCSTNPSREESERIRGIARTSNYIEYYQESFHSNYMYSAKLRFCNSAVLLLCSERFDFQGYKNSQIFPVIFNFFETCLHFSTHVVLSFFSEVLRVFLS